MATTLDPQLLQQILAMMQGQGMTGNNATQWAGSGDLADWTVDQRRDVIGHTGGDSGTEMYSDPITRLYQSTGSDTWKTNGDTADVFDAQGNFIGGSSGDSTSLGLAKAILASIGGYYGVQGVDAMTAGGAAAEAGAGASTAGAAAGPSTVAFDVGSMAPIEWGAAELGTIPVSNAAAGTLGTTMLQEAGKTAASQALQNSQQKQSTGSGLNMGSLLGLAAGMADGKDSQQTSSRDPWAPAQPVLKGLLGELPQLYDRYKQQPFSGAQQTAYGNQGGLLDAINSNAGGLLQGFGANASGANNYDRANPRKQLTGGAAMDLSQWLPGLLGGYGTGGR